MSPLLFTWLLKLLGSLELEITFDCSSISFLDGLVLLQFEELDVIELGSLNLEAYLKCSAHFFLYKSAAFLPAFPKYPFTNES